MYQVLRRSTSRTTFNEQLADGKFVPVRRARGFTLPEVLIAMTIMATLSVVIGGLVNAVNTAWDYSTNTEDATVQARATVERIQYMISNAGVYQTDGKPPRLGIRVVNHKWSLFDLPDVLVIWSGGREGGIADTGIIDRLPHVDELVIYTPSANAANRFVEIVVPGDSSEIDFGSKTFESRILSLIEAKNAEEALLCDRIRVSELPGWYVYKQAGLANVRFQLEQTPTDEDLAATDPGSDAWQKLMWAQGIVTGDAGMRQATVFLEFQLRPNEETGADTDLQLTDAIPVFGSGSYRYVYQP